MKIYILLFIAHIVGDVLLQKGIVSKGKNLSKLKRQNLIYMVLHVLLYSLSVSAILVYLQLFTMVKFIIIFISHYIIDYLKCYVFACKANSPQMLMCNIVDQLSHFIFLVIIANLK